MKATGVEEEGEFVVLQGSEALKDAGYQSANSYGELKQELIAQGVLKPSANGKVYEFAKPHAFKSVSAAAAVVQQAEPMRLPPPSPAVISRMEEALAWLRWLKPEHAKLVWARAEGAPWKLICWRFGIARATAHRRWQYGLCLIAYRLIGRRVPAKRSHRFVTGLADGL